MRKRNSILSFVGAFAMTAGVIALAAALRSDDPPSDGSAATTSTVAATTEPTSAETGGASPTTVTPALPLSALPRPDLDQYCAAKYGPGYQVKYLAGNGLACAFGSTGKAEDFGDKNAPCATQIEENSRIIAPSVDSVWRCSRPASQSMLGDPDFDRACVALFGEAARPAFWANDWRGWRCAVVQNGIFFNHDLDIDTICSMQFGPNSWADAVNTTTGGWRCYGVEA